MKITEGELMPGVGIGDYRIGMKKRDLLKKLGNDYKERDLGGGESRINLENASIWLDQNDTVSQVGVTKGFEGMYDNTVKIGSTLKEIQEKYGGYREEYADYIINGIEGMCFELEDTGECEEWDELTAPIEWMFIYRVENEKPM